MKRKLKEIFFEPFPEEINDKVDTVVDSLGCKQDEQMGTNGTKCKARANAGLAMLICNCAVVILYCTLKPGTLDGKCHLVSFILFSMLVVDRST